MFYTYSRLIEASSELIYFYYLTQSTRSAFLSKIGQVDRYVEHYLNSRFCFEPVQI